MSACDIVTPKNKDSKQSSNHGYWQILYQYNKSVNVVNVCIIIKNEQKYILLKFKLYKLRILSSDSIPLYIN